ncbi:MAG: FlgD immunoglobulin-like domain containing protein, partial [Candidatus Latescibacterota bacterium]
SMAIALAGKNGIYRLNMDKSILEELSVDGYDPSWAPQGNKIVYTSMRDGNSEIYSLPGINLTRNAKNDYSPYWMPDGKILFSSDRDGNIRNYVMDSDGANLEEYDIYFQGNLVRTGRNFSWSPDGKLKVFVGLAVDDEDRSRGGIFILDTDTGEERLVFENSEHYAWGYEEFANPVISPDGKKIAFLSNRNSFYIDTMKMTVWDLNVVNTDGAGRTSLTKNIFGDTIDRVDWQPSTSSVLVNDTSDAAPSPFTLDPVHPNPFNPSTAISFTLSTPDRVHLAIYNVTGQKVRDLLSGHYSAGMHTATWDGRDGSGKQISSGIYIARLEAGGRTAARKMVLAR